MSALVTLQFVVPVEYAEGDYAQLHGTTVIDVIHQVDYCGDYKFALACYDQAGNVHEGDPAEALLPIHIAPPAPTGLAKNAYNKTTDTLTLNTA